MTLDGCATDRHDLLTRLRSSLRFSSSSARLAPLHWRGLLEPLRELPVRGLSDAPPPPAASAPLLVYHAYARSLAMAQFAPVSRNSMPYSEILGPVSAISAALESQGVRFAIEGKAALLIELYTSVDLSKLQVLDEMLKTQTPISTMIIDIWVDPSESHRMRQLFPSLRWDHATSAFYGFADRWSRMVTGGDADLFPMRFHLRHPAPDTIVRTLCGPGHSTQVMRVPIRSAADQLVDYCATIVAADPLRRWRGFEDILSKDAVHLMGLILRTAASIPLAQRATFSLGRWSTCTSHQTHRFPHDDYSKFVWELETILGWPEFVLWAAEEDRKAGHLGTETEVEEAWQKYSDFLKHILGALLPRIALRGLSGVEEARRRPSPDSSPFLSLQHSIPMAQFVPQASSPELPYCQILGPIYHLGQTFDQHRVRYAVEGEAALLTEIWTSDTPAGLFVYDEIAFRTEELRSMVVELWLHPDDVGILRPFFPGTTLPPRGSEGSASHILYAYDWHTMGYGHGVNGGAPHPWRLHLRFRHKEPDVVSKMLLKSGAGMDYVMVHIKTAAATLLDYFITIVAADPLAHGDDFTHIPLAASDIHMMGLIIRTQLAYNQLESSDFSINFWQRALRGLAHGGHLPRSGVDRHSMREQDFLNAVYNIVTHRAFAPWAAAADHHFRAEHDLVTFLHAWLNYSHAIELFVAQYIPYRISTHRQPRQLPALPMRPHNN
ncbi:Proteophosphoglycan ppg4 [Rhodotorula toruloides ATCC 204091]|uniref:Proteophosphoglycan ppg4 n=2 Tax=Rhodotorula toruloides TaxID=5286 RepID=A0A2S9ZW17_RHOTO|nr:Proteophosphoglycan ppg4 [Rhodotorula toruloides ATCC 204091]PRQ69950.1 Proteophosphoglycan ppg4 [Rhodotorula toruloides]